MMRQNQMVFSHRFAALFLYIGIRKHKINSYFLIVAWTVGAATRS